MAVAPGGAAGRAATVGKKRARRHTVAKCLRGGHLRGALGEKKVRFFSPLGLP